MVVGHGVDGNRWNAVTKRASAEDRCPFSLYISVSFRRRLWYNSSDIMVEFKALRSALIDQPEVSNRQDGGLADKIIEVIYNDSSITVLAIADSLDISKRTVEREMKKLRESGCIVRQGGKRHGYWQIID